MVEAILFAVRNYLHVPVDNASDLIYVFGVDIILNNQGHRLKLLNYALLANLPEFWVSYVQIDHRDEAKNQTLLLVNEHLWDRVDCDLLRLKSGLLQLRKAQIAKSCVPVAGIDFVVIFPVKCSSVFLHRLVRHVKLDAKHVFVTLLLFQIETTFTHLLFFAFYGYDFTLKSHF